MRKRFRKPLYDGVKGFGVKDQTKYCDITSGNSGSYNFDTNPSHGTVNVNAIAEGYGVNQRVGRKIAMKKFLMQGMLRNYGSAPTSIIDYNRIILVYDKQTNQTAPLWSDVVQCYTNVNGVSNFATDMYNLNNRDRFIILKDIVFTSPAQNNNEVNEGGFCPTAKEHRFKFEVDLQCLETQYNDDQGPGGGGPSVADINSGGLFFIMQSLFEDNFWGIDFSCRLEFSDN